MNSILTEKLKNLPNNPGVYQFKDSSGEIIYVGKAKNLKNRVGSYFHIKLEEETKTGALVSRINDIEWIIVESEFDALILEAELIKKYRPKYNIIQKDDKSYLYIVIRDESLKVNSVKIKLSKIITARKTELMPKDVIFGPYPDGSTAKFVVRTLRKLFPYRDCAATKFNSYHKKLKPCLYGQLHICPAPCVNFSEPSQKDYSKNIQSIKRILKGGSFNVLSEINKKMNMYAKLKQYEQAAKYRDLLAKYKYVRQRYKLPDVYMENPTFIADRATQSLEELRKELPILNDLPTRIECYDISNISGKEAVGSMVVATDGLITKKEYKRFKIKRKNSPDDFEMMREVLERRLSHHSKNNDTSKKIWSDPSLLVIDGGKGQISAVFEVLDSLNLEIPVVGLAKKEETLVYKMNGVFIELKLAKSNLGLNLLIRLRDEAHRFAKEYHHKVRSSTFLN